ncbi:hypothetical protein V6Z11_A10G258000 [Gossypium hirsutum]
MTPSNGQQIIANDSDEICIFLFYLFLFFSAIKPKENDVNRIYSKKDTGILKKTIKNRKGDSQSDSFFFFSAFFFFRFTGNFKIKEKGIYLSGRDPSSSSQSK